MLIEQSAISDVYVIKPNVLSDPRGSFIKLFHEETFKIKGLQYSYKESYYSLSAKDVIRGMHLQIPPYEYAKLVYVTNGEILDVILDLRKTSKTFKKFISIDLSDENRFAVYVPEGCAHGFGVLSDNATVVYMQTSVYSPVHDTGIRWDSFGMDWGIDNPIVSLRDKNLILLEDFITPFEK
jgi:dTDP-4-dehydrorhamnose 3,5-epimerase